MAFWKRLLGGEAGSGHPPQDGNSWYIATSKDNRVRHVVVSIPPAYQAADKVSPRAFSSWLRC